MEGGVNQGCPLSSSLVTIVLHEMFSLKLNANTEAHHINGKLGDDGIDRVTNLKVSINNYNCPTHALCPLLIVHGGVEIILPLRKLRHQVSFLQKSFCFYLRVHHRAQFFTLVSKLLVPSTKASKHILSVRSDGKVK